MLNWFRKDRLFVPEEVEEVKGKSMIGYSRRSFFGMLGAGALIGVTAEPLMEAIKGTITSGSVTIWPSTKVQTLSSLFDEMADAADMKWGIEPAGEVVFSMNYDHTANIMALIGKQMQVNLGVINEVMQVESVTVQQPPDKPIEYQISLRGLTQQDKVSYNEFWRGIERNDV